MKRLTQTSLIAALLYAVILATGCYSPRKLPATRLQHVLKMEGIQYVAMDEEDQSNKIWLLSDITLEDQAMTARFKKAPEGFGAYVQKIRSNQSQKMNQDFVYLYLPSAQADSIQDNALHRLEFSQISKIVVFEKDAAEMTGAACLGVWGLGILYGLLYWTLEGF